MSADKKNKKNGIERLRTVLDNPSIRNLNPEDEKNLIVLKERLSKKNLRVVIKKSVDVEYSAEDLDPESLKPKVIVHLRKQKKVVAEPKVEVKKDKEPVLEFKEVATDEEDLIEIKKVEIKEPEFIEVKPKQIEKKEKEELPEWQPVEEKKEEAFIEVEKTKEEKVVLYCPRCNTSINEDDKFCQNCGAVLTEEIEKETNSNIPIPKFTAVEKEKEEPKDVEWQQAESSNALIESESKEIVAQEEKDESAKEEEVIVEEEKPKEVETPVKLEVFQDFESIDSETANKLYKSGFTSVDALAIASAKDIAKTSGIKKKKAKQLKKEIQENSKELSGYKTPESIDSSEVEVTEEQVKDLEEPGVSVEEKASAFREMESIDEDTAVLLYDNGVTTEDSLKDLSARDISKIKGIKRKKAKEIIAERDKKIEESIEVKPINIDETAEKEISEEEIKEEIEDFKEEKQDAKESPVELSQTDAEWSPIDEDEEIEEETEEEIAEKYEKIEELKTLVSIDDDVALLLYGSGYTTVESLKELKVKDITKIKGIKKKKAKEIVKDLEQHFKLLEKEEEKEEEEFFGEEVDDESETLDDKISDFEDSPDEKIEHVDFIEEELEDDIPDIKADEYLFSEIPSVNKKISILLKENDITTLGELNEKTVKDLTKIKGIRRKVAKQIKKEVKQHIRTNGDKDESYTSVEENPYIEEQDSDEEWETFEGDVEPQGFMHGDYTLYEKEITTKSGNHRLIRFFSKGEPDDANPIDIPDGFEVIENKKTGVPYLRKVK